MDLDQILDVDCSLCHQSRRQSRPEILDGVEVWTVEVATTADVVAVAEA